MYVLSKKGQWLLPGMTLVAWVPLAVSLRSGTTFLPPPTPRWGHLFAPLIAAGRLAHPVTWDAARPRHYWRPRTAAPNGAEMKSFCSRTILWAKKVSVQMKHVVCLALGATGAAWAPASLPGWLSGWRCAQSGLDLASDPGCFLRWRFSCKCWVSTRLR